MQFQALMKKIEVKSLLSGDKSGRLLLEFDIYPGKDSIIDELNKKMKADSFVKVTIEEGDEV